MTGVYLSEALSPPSFCLGWSSKFVGCESGQSVKLLQNMDSNTTQQLPMASHTSVYTVLWEGEGGGVAQVVEVQQTEG